MDGKLLQEGIFWWIVKQNWSDYMVSRFSWRSPDRIVLYSWDLVLECCVECCCSVRCLSLCCSEIFLVDDVGPWKVWRHSIVCVTVLLHFLNCMVKYLKKKKNLQIFYEIILSSNFQETCSWPVVPCTEDLYLQGPKQVGPAPPETFFKNSWIIYLNQKNTKKSS